jgi:hypothetical protein
VRRSADAQATRRAGARIEAHLDPVRGRPEDAGEMKADEPPAKIGDFAKDLR